ncbi:MAG TPA: glutamate--tRNA ligase [Planctomycetota bacterium]|nr:glutamate--tRNA ligase [Planctomycetota bacterium]
MSAGVRVRYAPSPTGFQHIGNIRTALFNWLFARHEGGKFIIRIEDTDRERSREEYVTQILDDFRWLGLDWDEGPEVGGDHGPYRQSERLHIYRTYADRLLAEEKAYPCWCTAEELEARRQAAKKTGLPPADTRCRDASAEDRRRFEAEGRPRSLRFRVGEDRKITFDDLVLGPTTFDSRQIGDFVILKSDGWPTYHFGVVVDDWLMEVTHVIRAEGHLSNTPLHVMLMEALKAPRPAFAHLPSVLSADGKGKLSKRLGALSMVEYRRQGYLPEALVNFMALLGWSPGEDREFMTREELIQSFTLERVKKSSARFDTEKLTWMNQKYIAGASTARLVELAGTFIDTTALDVAWLEKLVEVYREKLKTVADLPALAHFLFTDAIEYNEKDVKKFLLASEGAGLATLREVRDALAALDAWTATKIEETLKHVVETKGVGFGKVAQPVRVAVTGTSVSPGIYDTLALLGRERSLKRMNDALQKFATT